MSPAAPPFALGAVATSTATFNGVSASSASDWSDGGITAAVPSGATTGPVVVTVSGVSTNGASFTVTPVPAILSVTPAIGAPGDTVTIAGSHFGTAQGSGQVWLGTAAATVVSWNDTQIVATVAANAQSGNAQVLQNGVMSNPWAFTVNIPQITGISPTSGAAGTLVTFSGSGFGATQGSVTLGSMAGLVQNWSDTQVTALVASGSVTGIARIQRSDGLLSNALGFTVPAAGGGGNTLMPSLLNMAVGDTHTIQALGADGKEVTGLTWTTSDATIVSLSTDDPPLLTALAPGHVTIQAGSASADVTVWAGALPVGTVLWSNPGNGSGVQYIVPAVPSPNGVADVFAFQKDGTVQAITAEGKTAWTADVSQAIDVWPWPVLPDFQGGLVVAGTDPAGNNSIRRLDGMTGTSYGAYSCGGFGCGELMAVHTDGTVFAIRGTGEPGTLAVVGIDPTGAEKFSLPLQVPAGPLVNGLGSLGLIIAGDGYAYVPYGWLQHIADSSSGTGNLRILRVGSDGSSQDIPIYQWTFPDIDEGPLIVRGLITNADQGAVMTFGTGETGGGYEWMVTVTGGSTNRTQLSQDLTPVLQAQDGTFVGTYYGENGQNMAAFDAGGNILWSVPNEWPAIATADGGVIGESGTTYDANGMATGSMNLATPSWTGNSYQIGSIDQVFANYINWATSRLI